jgi:steroid 5-alpha reductase family enzyme
MTVQYLEALAAIAVALSVLMAGAWLLQQRTGNSGWVDTIWTSSLGLVVIFVQNQGPALSTGYFWGWATLLAPVFMYWILVHVTGIPPLEAQMPRSRGDLYRDYQSRTSEFFPLPPHALREWSHELRFHDHRHRRTGAAA